MLLFFLRPAPRHASSSHANSPRLNSCPSEVPIAKTTRKSTKKSTKKAVKKTAKKTSTTRRLKAAPPQSPPPAPPAPPEAPAAPPAPALPPDAPPDTSRDFALKLAVLARNDRCTNVTVLDVKGLSPVTDFLVIATGTSGRQMRSTADDAIELGKELDFAPLSSSGGGRGGGRGGGGGGGGGGDSESWICVDFVHVLLHIFSEDARAYYDLESLWGDAKTLEVPPP